MPTVDRRIYKRLQPPKNLGIVEQHLWKMIVDALPATHFAKCDIPTLALYCRHYVQHERAMTELEDADRLTVIAANGAFSQHPMVNTVAKFAATLTNLAMRLRIVPQARIATKEKAANPEFDGAKATDGDSTDRLFFSS